jgi:hypothetical protein
MLFHKHLFFFLAVILTENAFCQNTDDIPYEKETVAGINMNTNGGIIGGAMFKHSVHLKKNQYHLFAFEVVNVKHPKEQRYSSSVTGNTFLFYKQNYFFVLRPQYGREIILFNKSEEEGARVNGIIATGPSIGILKPYAIDYDYTDYASYSGPPIDVRSEAFDPGLHTNPQSRILGTGGLFTAAGKSKFTLGWSLKAGLAFELANSTTGIEVGGLIEIYPKEIIIIPSAQNRMLFGSVYVNIYYGLRD